MWINYLSNKAKWVLRIMLTCRAKLFALQWWMPSSTVLMRMTGRIGPKGSSQAILMSGRTWSISIGQIRFPSLLHSYMPKLRRQWALWNQTNTQLSHDVHTPANKLCFDSTTLSNSNDWSFLHQNVQGWSWMAFNIQTTQQRFAIENPQILWKIWL